MTYRCLDDRRLAERTNQFIIDQTSACLAHAGLPTCYWVQAITTLCHLMNIEEVNGSSAWMRLHGEEFKGEKIPFGALVDFKPSEARKGKREKFEPRRETGIFAGYVLSTGMHWANKYRAWALTAFGCRAEHQEGEGSTSVENATSDGEDDFEISSDIPNTTEVQGCQRDFGRDRDVYRRNRSGCA